MHALSTSHTYSTREKRYCECKGYAHAHARRSPACRRAARRACRPARSSRGTCGARAAREKRPAVSTGAARPDGKMCPKAEACAAAALPRRALAAGAGCWWGPYLLCAPCSRARPLRPQPQAIRRGPAGSHKVRTHLSDDALGDALEGDLVDVAAALDQIVVQAKVPQPALSPARDH